MNFSAFSKHATAVELLLFDAVDDAKAARVARLDPSVNRTYHYWHVFVADVRPGQLYAYRAEGPFDPFDPSNGMRFDPSKVLLDPYARAVVVPDTYARDAARDTRDDAGTAMKSVVADVAAYDWEGTRRSSDRRRGPSCTRCTCAASPVIRAPGLGRRHAARSPV